MGFPTPRPKESIKQDIFALSPPSDSQTTPQTKEEVVVPFQTIEPSKKELLFIKKQLSFFHPAQFRYRFLILIFVGLNSSGASFCWDAPAVIDLYISHVQLGALFASYSLPNIIMPVFGGMFVSRVGYNKASFVFSLLLVLGNIVFALSPLFGEELKFSVMIIARIISGIGGESLSLCRSTILSKWFEGKELTMSYGVSTTFGRLASVLAFGILPPLQRSGLFYALGAMVVFSSLSLFSSLIVWFMDVRGWRILGEENHGEDFRETNQVEMNNIESSQTTDVETDVKSVDNVELINNNIESLDNVELLENVETDVESVDNVESIDNNIESLDNVELLEKVESSSENITKNEMKPESKATCFTPYTQFSGALYLAIFVTFAYYSTNFGMLSFLVDFLKDTQKLSHQEATSIASIPRWTALFFTAPLSFLPDFFGKRAHLLLLGTITMTVSYSFFLFPSNFPAVLFPISIAVPYLIIPLVLWPNVTLLSKEKFRSQAFGVAFSFLNFGLFIGPFCYGWFRQSTGSWVLGTSIFLGVAILAVAASFSLILEDRRTMEGILAKPSKTFAIPSFLTKTINFLRPKN